MPLLTRYFRNLLINGVRYSSKATRENKVSRQRKLLQDVDSMKEFDYKATRHHLKIYVWGLAETGALGIQKSLKQHKQSNCTFVQHPSRLAFGERNEVINISAGYGFTVFVVKCNEDGVSLFGTGINTDSQIGYHKHRGVTNKPIEILIYPAPIFLPKTSPDEKIQVVKAATGRAHTVALTVSGTVFTLGNNAYGQCARDVVIDEEYFGSEIIHRINTEIFKNQKIVDVHCGQDHSMFITETGSVYSCGWSADGQTGLGHYNNQHNPELIEGDIKNEKIVKLSCAGDCVLALNDKGEVFGWGNSEYGQISQTEGIEQINVATNLSYLKDVGKVVDIASGGSFCAVLNEAGDVFVWGFGLLGLGPQVDYVKKPQIIPPTLFGRNPFNPQSRVISINCGMSHMTAINSDNDLFTWGRNKYGCLGLGHEKDQFFPYKAMVGAKVQRVTCGVDHTIALCKSFI